MLSECKHEKQNELQTHGERVYMGECVWESVCMGECVHGRVYMVDYVHGRPCAFGRVNIIILFSYLSLYTTSYYRLCVRIFHFIFSYLSLFPWCLYCMLSSLFLLFFSLRIFTGYAYVWWKFRNNAFNTIGTWKCWCLCLWCHEHWRGDQKFKYYTEITM